MFDLVVGQLERQDVDEISDLLLSPPETGKYQAIKQRLLQVYEESEHKQLQRLLSEMELGDMKPSQLLRRMKTLACKSIADTTLKLMWMNHLPQSTRAVLAVSENIMKQLDLEELALMADKIAENSQPVSSVSVVETTPSTSSQHQQKTLEEKIEFLCEEIAELKTNQSWHRGRRMHRNYRGRSYRPRSRSSNNRRPSSNPSPHRSLGPRTENSEVCYYHRRFGKEAYRCLRPCNYESKNNQSEN